MPLHQQTTGRRVPTLAALTVLTVMAVAGTSLFALRYGFDSYRAGLDQAIQLAESAELARTAQMNFKYQVQEWKNILLRGSDQQDYHTYLNQFEQREAKVTEDLGRLNQLLAGIGDQPHQAQVGAIQEHMKTLGIKYREALAAFRPEDRTSTFAVDRQVRGIDREPTARLDELAENLSHRSKEILQEATVSSEQLYASLRTALQIISGIAIILTVALAVIKSRT
jgi:hypothetical protein